MPPFTSRILKTTVKGTCEVTQSVAKFAQIYFKKSCGANQLASSNRSISSDISYISDNIAVLFMCADYARFI